MSLMHRCSYPCVLFLRDRSLFTGEGGGRATMFGVEGHYFFSSTLGGPFFKKIH